MVSFPLSMFITQEYNTMLNPCLNELTYYNDRIGFIGVGDYIELHELIVVPTDKC